MPVLLLSPEFPYPIKNGFQFTQLEMMRLLVEADCELSFVGLHTPDNQVDLDSLPADIRSLADFTAVSFWTPYSSTQVFTNFFFQQDSLYLRQYHQLAVEKALTDLCQKTAYDLAIIVDVRMGQYVPLLRQLGVSRCYLWMMNTHEKAVQASVNQAIFFRNEIQQEALKRWESYQYAQWTQGLYDKIIGFHADLSQRILRKVREAVEDKTGKNVSILTQQIGWDMPPEADNPTPPVRQAQTVVFVGNMQNVALKQAFERFVNQTWAGLYRHFPSAQLFLVSKTPLQAISQSWIDMHIQQEDRLETTGELYDFLATKSILVVPVAEFDGVQKKVWEGMAMGCAVLTHTEGTLGLAVKQGGELLVAADEKTFTQQLALLLESPSLVEVLGKNAQTFCRQRLSWQQSVEAVREWL